MSELSSIGVLRHQVENTVSSAIIIARSYLLMQTPYNLGSKDGNTLDCSGLTARCYPGALPHGVERQAEAFGRWLFTNSDVFLSEVGDLLFLANIHEPAILSHVAIIEEVGYDLQKHTVIHASESNGCVCRDSWEHHDKRFKKHYRVAALGKIRQYLIRNLLGLDLK